MATSGAKVTRVSGWEPRITPDAPRPSLPSAPPTIAPQHPFPTRVTGHCVLALEASCPRTTSQDTQGPWFMAAAAETWAAKCETYPVAKTGTRHPVQCPTEMASIPSSRGRCRRAPPDHSLSLVTCGSQGCDLSAAVTAPMAPPVALPAGELPCCRDGQVSVSCCEPWDRVFQGSR